VKIDAVRCQHIAQQVFEVAQQVFEEYKKDQYKWWKRMDGTPILNDITVRMAEAYFNRFYSLLRQDEEKLRLAAQSALQLLDLSLAHVSHGGPTRADAEKVAGHLRAALAQRKEEK